MRSMINLSSTASVEDETNMVEINFNDQPLKIKDKECEIYVDVGYGRRSRDKLSFFTRVHPFIIE